MTISILLNYCIEVINIMSRTMSELKVKFRNWHIYYYNNINLQMAFGKGGSFGKSGEAGSVGSKGWSESL